MSLLAGNDDPAIQADVLRGMHDALRGRRRVAMPEGWPAVYRKLTASTSAEVRDEALFLALLFDDPQALTTLRKTAGDHEAPAERRRSALDALVHKKLPDLVPVLHGLLDDPVVRAAAIRGLAAYDDPATPGLVLSRYGSLTEAEKADAVQTLASRPAYARALVQALAAGKVARRDLSAFTVRQLLLLRDAQVTATLNRAWGTLRPASQEKAALTARYKALLTPDYLGKADRARGRVLFTRTCASCHVLFGEGGKIGPELTGSQRANLDYVLENVLDPSAVVPRDYQVTVLQTTDGRTVTGIIKEESERVVTVQTPNEVLSIPKAEIEERVRSPLSLMPEGLFSTLKDDEVRDLVGYLASPTQVPLPPGAGR